MKWDVLVLRKPGFFANGESRCIISGWVETSFLNIRGGGVIYKLVSQVLPNYIPTIAPRSGPLKKNTADVWSPQQFKGSYSCKFFATLIGYRQPNASNG